MRLLVQQGNFLHRAPATVDKVSSVVVFDDDGQPLLVVEHIGSATVRSVKLGDKEFAAALARHGILNGMPQVHEVTR